MQKQYYEGVCEGETQCAVALTFFVLVKVLTSPLFSALYAAKTNEIFTKVSVWFFSLRIFFCVVVAAYHIGKIILFPQWSSVSNQNGASLFLSIGFSPFIAIRFPFLSM